jgi:hypothetical protein
MTIPLSIEGLGEPSDANAFRAERAATGVVAALTRMECEP